LRSALMVAAWKSYAAKTSARRRRKSRGWLAAHAALAQHASKQRCRIGMAPGLPRRGVAWRGAHRAHRRGENIAQKWRGWKETRRHGAAFYC